MPGRSWSMATRDAWDALGGSHYLPLSQAWEWGEAKRAVGQKVARLSLDARVGVQFESRWGVVWAPGAPLGDSDATTEAAMKQLSRQLGRPILLSPTAPVPGLQDPVATDLFHTGTVLFELSPHESEIRRRLHGYWRNHLSKAERADTEVVDGTRSQLHQMLEELAQRKGFTVPYDARFIEALQAAFGAGFTIRIARHSGRDVAVLLDLRAGNTATSLLGAATPEGRKVRASYLLTWDALVRHRAAGAWTYDLGNIGRDRSSGPSAFKMRSGGDVVEFPGTFLIGGGARARAVRPFLHLTRLLRHHPQASPDVSGRGAT
jgi:hypothetical protein